MSLTKFFQKYFFQNKRQIFVLAICLLIGVYLIKITSVKVYSESDVMYRQEGIFGFSTEGLVFNKSSNISFNANSKEITNPVITDEKEQIRAAVEPVYITPTPTPVPLPTIVSSSSDVWMNLASCEAGQRWNADTGNGYYGAFQFSQSAWESVGGTGKPSDASADEQLMRAQMLQKARGWGAWGLCAVRLGLR